MAKLVGSSGAVWAFEPASDVADILEQSIALNDKLSGALFPAVLGVTGSYM